MKPIVVIAATSPVDYETVRKLEAEGYFVLEALTVDDVKVIEPVDVRVARALEHLRRAEPERAIAILEDLVGTSVTPHAVASGPQTGD